MPTMRHASPPAALMRPPLLRPSQSLTPLWAAALAMALCMPACRKAQPPALPAPSTNPVPATAAVATQPVQSLPSPALLPSNAPPVEARIQSLAASFKTAAPETQARIAEALQTFQAGQKREAVTKLKLIDADTELTADQQQSVKELITIIRQ